MTLTPSASPQLSPPSLPSALPRPVPLSIADLLPHGATGAKARPLSTPLHPFALPSLSPPSLGSASIAGVWGFYPSRPPPCSRARLFSHCIGGTYSHSVQPVPPPGRPRWTVEGPLPEMGPVRSVQRKCPGQGTGAVPRRCPDPVVSIGLRARWRPPSRPPSSLASCSISLAPASLPIPPMSPLASRPTNSL